MDPNTQKFIDNLRSITLTEGERASLRTSLISKMGTPRARAVVSPLSWLFTSRIEIMALSLVIMVSYSSSVALAASGSLPGDTLYPIKTHISEPLERLVMATTPAKEASFETTLLEKRLAEAEALDGKLDTDPSLKQAVRQVVEAQSRIAETKVSDIAPRPGAVTFKAVAPIQVLSREATSSPQVFSVEQASDVSDHSGGEDGDTEQALKGVYEKHKNILEKLDLHDGGKDKRGD